MEETYCRVCKVVLNGLAPAKQHYTSERHKKKESAACDITGPSATSTVQQTSEACAPVNDLPDRAYEFNGVHGKCFLCDIVLTSKEHMEQHLSGKKHAKKEKNWEEQRNMAGPCSASTMQQPSQACASVNDLPDRAYEFNGVNGKCFLCDIVLTSKEHKEQHLRGKNHAKKEKTWEEQRNMAGPSSASTVQQPCQACAPVNDLPDRAYAFNGVNGKCFLCDIVLTSKEHKEQHLTGKNHAKKEKNWEEQRNMAGPSPASTVQQPSQACAPVNDLPDRAYKFNGVNGKCFLCDIVLTSKEHKEQHLRGKNHAKKEKNWEEQRNMAGPSSASTVQQPSQACAPVNDLPDRAYEFNGVNGKCFLCDIVLTSKEHKEQHLRGKNHAKKEKNREEQCKMHERGNGVNSFSGNENNMLPTAAPPLQAQVVSGTFMRCDGNGKPINTCEQLERHPMTPKCLKQEQKESHMQPHPQHQRSTEDESFTSTRTSDNSLISYGATSFSTMSYNAGSTGGSTVPFQHQDVTDFCKKVPHATSTVPQPVGSNRPNPNAMAPQPSYNQDLGQWDSMPFSGPPSGVSMPYERSLKNCAPEPDNGIPRNAPLQQWNNTLSQQQNSTTPQQNNTSSQQLNNTPPQQYLKSCDFMTSLDLQEEAYQNQQCSNHKQGQGEYLSTVSTGPAGLNPCIQPTSQVSNPVATQIKTPNPRAALVPTARALVPSQDIDGATTALGNLTLASPQAGLTEELKQMIEKGVTTDCDDCRINCCNWHCIICDTHNRGGHNKIEHLDGKLHKKMLDKYLKRQDNS